jgi:hypothetical protein
MNTSTDISLTRICMWVLVITCVGVALMVWLSPVVSDTSGAEGCELGQGVWYTHDMAQGGDIEDGVCVRNGVVIFKSGDR